MSIEKHECCDDDFDFEGGEFVELERNIGRVITVFTKSGGCSGRGFTGLLVRVDCHFIKLITSIPSAPRHPFGRQFEDCCCDFFSSRRNCERSRFGTVILIPICDIVSFVFNEV
jgi:hypothetical protein